MAINPEQEFVSGRRNDATVDYPYGSAKDRDGGVPGTATPALIANVINDIWGLLQGLLSAAAITPNGNPDTAVGAGAQYMEALLSKGIFGADAIGLPLKWGDKSSNQVELEINANPGGADDAYFVVRHGSSNTSFGGIEFTVSGGVAMDLYNFGDTSLTFTKANGLKIWNATSSIFVKPDRITMDGGAEFNMLEFDLSAAFSAPNTLAVNPFASGAGVTNNGYVLQGRFPVTPYTLTGVPYNAIIRGATLDFVNTNGQKWGTAVTIEKNNTASGSFQMVGFDGLFTLPSFSTLSTAILSVFYKPV